MLKYEHIEKYTKIRAYDFEFRRDCYIEGEVQGHVNWSGVKFLKVFCWRDVFEGVENTGRAGDYVHVPMQVGFEEEWNEPRIVILKNSPNGVDIVSANV